MAGFLIRWAVAFGLVAATFNPTEYNFLRWSMTHGMQNLPLALLIGLLLLTGYIIYLRATLRSIGAFGMILIAAILGALGWVLYDYGILKLDNRGLVVWLGILSISFVMGVGLGWSIVRRTISGQLDVDETDE